MNKVNGSKRREKLALPKALSRHDALVDKDGDQLVRLSGNLMSTLGGYLSKLSLLYALLAGSYQSLSGEVYLGT